MHDISLTIRTRFTDSFNYYFALKFNVTTEFGFEIESRWDCRCEAGPGDLVFFLKFLFGEYEYWVVAPYGQSC